jgi:methionyl-tRNA synthetase
VTALLEPEATPTLDNALKDWWPINLHLIGKDILRFHAVYWPAMLMSAELSLPGAVYGHGFLTKDGQKMGKSLGNTLDPVALVDRYGADAVRYYFLKEIAFGRDGDFKETRFIDILNADLANDLGNLLNRTLKMTLKYCSGTVPAVDPQTMPQDWSVVQLAQTAGERAIDAYSVLNFSVACESALGMVRAGNKFIDEQAPWSRHKAGEFETVNQILYAVLESVRLAAYLLAPIVPNLSTKIYQQLGYALDFNDLDSPSSSLSPEGHECWGCLSPGQILGQAEPVFQKLIALNLDLAIETS